MQPNHILLFGAGKSASVLIDYLIDSAGQNNWTITVADADERLILKKTKSRPGSAAVQLDIQNEHKRKEYVNGLRRLYIDIKNTLTYGDVDFDKSNIPYQKGKLYLIYGQTIKKDTITLRVINYDSKAVLEDIIRKK